MNEAGRVTPLHVMGAEAPAEAGSGAYRIRTNKGGTAGYPVPCRDGFFI